MSARELITEHLDLWTGAVTQKSTRGRGSNGKVELTGIKKLRELILDLAIRGKLVEQDTNDEPAITLLEQVTALREKLVTEGKLRKLKQRFPAEGADKPFEIPGSWTWATLPDVASYTPGKTPSTKDPKFWATGTPGIPWVSIADLNHYGTVQETTKGVTQAAAKEVFKSGLIEPGSILMSFKLTVGKISITEIPVYHNEAIISITPFEGVNREYLFKVMPIVALGGNTKRAIMGNTLNATSLAQILVPLPPEGEQHRIVEKVDELMALCDRLEQQTSDQLEAHETLVDTLLGTLTQSENATELADNWARLAAHFDALFTTEQSIDKLKQAVLQLAVIGWLVEQDENDEPASLLLARIAEEKVQLAKEGKIKAPKKLAGIRAEDIDRQPSGWEATRFGDLVNIRSELVKALDYPDLDQVAPDSIEKGTGKLRFRRTVKESGAKGPNNRFKRGQILYSKIRPSLSKVLIAEFDGLCSADMYPIDSFIDSKYLLLAILSEPFLAQVRSAENRIKMPKLNIESLSNIVTNLPPEAEQHRIVRKAEELMALCDQLKEHLNKASETRCQLAEGIVEGALKS